MEYTRRKRCRRPQCSSLDSKCEDCQLDMIRQRHERAADYFESYSFPVEIIRVDDNTHRVKSFTDPECNDHYSLKIYTVTKRETKECDNFVFDCTLVCQECKICFHEFHCDCIDYRSRNTICKHIHAARIWEASPEHHCSLYEYDDDDDDEHDTEWDEDDDDHVSDNEDDRELKLLRLRHRRAVEYLEENPVSRIEDIGFNMYLVPSFSSLKIYTVTRSDTKECGDSGLDCTLVCEACKICSHEFYCDCSDYQSGNTICKHIHAVRISGYAAAPATPEKPKKLFLYSGNVSHVLDI